MQHWRALIEAGEMGHIITIPDTGEEIYLLDLMVGIDSLPPRQREAFELICILGYTETDATKIMLPNSRWSTPVQQYADSALVRMIQAYDDKQAGTWVYTRYEVKRKKKRKKPESLEEVLDIIKEGKCDDAAADSNP